MAHLRLLDAVLCCDDGCDVIRDNPHRCPVCGSTAQGFKVSRAIEPTSGKPVNLPLVDEADTVKVVQQ